MLSISIPAFGKYHLHHLVLDVNGTLAVDGELLSGVSERISSLKKILAIHLITANTYNRQDEIDSHLGVKSIRLSAGSEAAQKAEFVRQLGHKSVVAIGNGANDREMLKASALGIVVLEGEGSAVQAIMSADIVCTSIINAFDLLLNPSRIKATLRN